MLRRKSVPSFWTVCSFWVMLLMHVGFLWMVAKLMWLGIGLCLRLWIKFSNFWVCVTTTDALCADLVSWRLHWPSWPGRMLVLCGTLSSNRLSSYSKMHCVVPRFWRFLILSVTPGSFVMLVTSVLGLCWSRSVMVRGTLLSFSQNVWIRLRETTQQLSVNLLL